MTNKRVCDKSIKLCKKCKKDISLYKNRYVCHECIIKNNCPCCGKKLYKKYYGHVCKNNKCSLYYKLERGWVKLDKTSGWSKKRMINTSFYSSNSRLFLANKFAKLKQKILIRDDYTCQKCDKCEDIEVHHIIPANEEMILYLDPDNLISLCNKCHREIHSEDMRRFG